MSATEVIDELEQYAALLAAETSPAVAASELRRIADEIAALHQGEMQ